MPGYDFEQLEIRSATKRCLTLREWRQQPEDDQARMIAFDLKESTVEAYREEFREKNAPNKGKPGDRELDAMMRQRHLDRRG